MGDEVGFLRASKYESFLQVDSITLGMEVLFGMQINVEVSTSWYYPFSWKWPDMFKIRKIGSC